MVKVTYLLCSMIKLYIFCTFFLPNSYQINDRYEFPMEINLEEFLSEDADRSKPHKYLLHGFVYNFTLKLLHYQYSKII
jgi:hypothetical protein